ncbi:MAG: hypothetical protein KGH63_03375 [Candidatus Micrarchaeota archaeon]|nr:hypothetical protein [Candidatus Micrarchaeota archaeon]
MASQINLIADGIASAITLAMFLLGLLLGVPAAGRALRSPLGLTVPFLVTGFVLLAAGVGFEFVGDNFFNYLFDSGQAYGIVKDVLMVLGGLSLFVGMSILLRIEIRGREREGKA